MSRGGSTHTCLVLVQQSREGAEHQSGYVVLLDDENGNACMIRFGKETLERTRHVVFVDEMDGFLCVICM